MYLPVPLQSFEAVVQAVTKQDLVQRMRLSIHYWQMARSMGVVVCITMLLPLELYTFHVISRLGSTAHKVQGKTFSVQFVAFLQYM